ncbi:MAG: DUF2085 domain-containing protein [Wenzhouxiangella sp.]|nr:DUF2085 domain-containing protein [Wenzhouxiangella sp.]
MSHSPRQAPLCNGDPCSALRVAGFTLPLCARCLALIGGVLTGHACAAQLTPLLSLLLLGPVALDGALHHFFGIRSSNTRRLLTGLPGGYGLWALSETILSVFKGSEKCSLSSSLFC